MLDGELTYEQLDALVEGDPLEMRDRVWAELQKLRLQREHLAGWCGVDLSDLAEMEL